MAAIPVAAAMPYLIGLTAAGTAVSVLGAIRQGQAQSATADYNAKLARQNEQIAEAEGIAATDKISRDIAKQRGAAMAGYAASGTQMSEGSPADVLAESARLSALDTLNLQYNYKLKGLGYHNEASLSDANSANSSTAGYLNAAGSLLDGGSRIAGYYAFRK